MSNKSRKVRSIEEAVTAIPQSKPVERLITADVWGRGNANPLLRAFIKEQNLERTVKRSASEWMTLFREWKERPRG